MGQPTDSRAHPRPAPQTASPDTADVVGEALIRVVRALKKAHGNAPVEGPCLGVLHAVAAGGSARPSDVATQIALDASTVSRHLQSLERLGLVGRDRDPSDGRAYRVAVTPSGAEALDQARVARRAVLDTALSHWEAGDLDRLAGLLSRLADDLSPPATTSAAPSTPAAIGENR